MRRHITLFIFLFITFITWSQTVTGGQVFENDLYIISFLPNVERQCDLDSSTRTDECFEFYFSRKGNVIYKHYSPIEGEAWFYFGTYSRTDTGILYTTTNRYFVKMNTQSVFDNNGNEFVYERIDKTDYNKGKLKKLKPYTEFLYKNNCNEFPYMVPPVNYSKRVTIVINSPGTVSPGSVFETNDKQKERLLQKIKTITIFSDL